MGASWKTIEGRLNPYTSMYMPELNEKYQFILLFIHGVNIPIFSSIMCCKQANIIDSDKIGLNAEYFVKNSTKEAGSSKCLYLKFRKQPKDVCIYSRICKSFISSPSECTYVMKSY